MVTDDRHKKLTRMGSFFTGKDLSVALITFKVRRRPMCIIILC